MKLNKKALTLLEIIVALAIFALIITGMVNLFIAAQRHMVHSRSKISAGEVAKHYLDPLQMGVRQDIWGNNCVSAGINCDTATWTDSSGVDYQPTSYAVSNYTGNPPANDLNLQKVTLNLQWTEPQ